jgi:phosphoenolpyruvate-protein phosphotransferase/dihydroxyacetone kinase phosphotransfer subunit
VVGIVVVSHSETLAEGVIGIAREMAAPELAIEAAGGIGEAGVLGTSAERVREAVQRAMSAEGVLVLIDLGSALMSAELAVELLGQTAGPVRLSGAPLVEGAVAAAVAAGAGASLDEVAAEAERALEAKAASIEPPQSRPGSPQAEAAEDSVEVELAVLNAAGLHARPAARLVQTVGSFEAEVLICKCGVDAPPRSARSLTNIVALDARRGDRLRVLARGPQAREALAAIDELAAEGFGEGLEQAAARPQRGGESRSEAPGQTHEERAPATTPPRDGPTVLSGISVCAGFALAPAHRPDRPPTAIAEAERAQRSEGDGAAELIRLERGLTLAREQIAHDRERLRATLGAGEASIFDAHLALLEDEALLEPARAAIAAGAPAERAIVDAGEGVAEIYRSLEQAQLAERAADVIDVAGRVASALGTRDEGDPGPEPSEGDPGPEPSEPPEGPRPHVLVARELLPSQIARLDPTHVAGIATAEGSATSHAAIIARALGIPAVVGLGEPLMAVPEGTPLLIDGEAGKVTVAPDRAGVAGFQARLTSDLERRAAAVERAHEPARLASGERVEVFANVGSVEDARSAVRFGAEGVGLLRTEFLFLGRGELPSEDEQAQSITSIALALEGRPVVVRTLDAGADKPLPALGLPPEANPFLGLRGIRVGLEHRELFCAQLRAILRVAAEHPLRVMLPMVATLDEVQAARALLEETREQTGAAGRIQLGIMVEVPAAAICAAALAPLVDFFSIGTNDLTQYTMAAQRGDGRLARLLAEPQPAVLSLVQRTVEVAGEHGLWVGVCGEMAGDPACAVLLAGLGVSELSMAPRLIPAAKQALRGVTMERARAAAREALASTDARSARSCGARLL